MPADMEDYYRVLGVPPDAKPGQIKRAYRRRVLETHPDHGGDPAEFRRVRRAHAILSDPAARRRYDLATERAGHGARMTELFGRLFQGLEDSGRSLASILDSVDPRRGVG